ncbi:MAG: hypothetical protein SGJ21_04445 [Alphaproteobacteria bacterium]|nr:hypothetical protein [Alphaproteobacteria bacterium]
MKWLGGWMAAFVAASAGACSASDEPVSLAGIWQGTITCYSIEGPLQMTIEAATPEEAVMATGNGALEWDARVVLDAATSAVTIEPKLLNVEAGTLKGTLSGDAKVISGEMERQFCTSFSLTRQS